AGRRRRETNASGHAAGVSAKGAFLPSIARARLEHGRQDSVALYMYILRHPDEVRRGSLDELLLPARLHDVDAALREVERHPIRVRFSVFVVPEFELPSFGAVA